MKIKYTPQNLAIPILFTMFSTNQSMQIIHQSKKYFTAYRKMKKNAERVKKRVPVELESASSSPEARRSSLWNWNSTSPTSS